MLVEFVVKILLETMLTDYDGVIGDINNDALEKLKQTTIHNYSVDAYYIDYITRGEATRTG